MKKILLGLFLAGATLITTTSCTKEYITNMLPSFTRVFKVNANQWQYDKDSNGALLKNSIYVVLNIPEIDDYMMDQGSIAVAYSDDNEITYKSIGTTEATAFSFEYNIGRVVVKMQDPILDSNYEVHPPNKMVFKVTLTEADYVQ